MRQMRDSGIKWIEKIPAEWSTIRFKFLHNGMNTGEAIDKEFWSDDKDDILFYTAGIKPIRTNYSEFPEWKYTKESDLLLARNGTPYVFFPEANACYTDHIIRADMIKGINRRFVQYGLQQSINSVVVDSVSLATWSASLWNEQVIPYPSFSEQQTISSYLDSKCTHLDIIIEKTKSSIENCKKLKQAIITHAVTKGIRGDRPMKDSGIQWIGEIPEDWDIYRIGSLYEERREQGNDSLPILTVSINSGVSDRELSDEENDRIFVRSEDKTKYARVYPGDLTYNMMRAWQGAFGAVRVDGMVSPAYVIAKPKQDLDSRYMEALLRTESAKQEMKRYSYGIADFRLRLYWGYFKCIKVCLPPINEQKEIADYIDEKAKEIDDLIGKKEAFLEELDQYKKSMIYEYVTGKKEVAR